MATTITQARPLLTAAELDLFDQSRAEPIKALTLARLRGKVTRARTLRDKYRDLFRRQTVSVRGASTTKGRSPVGADNERTQRKADILQEVLSRFEARVTQLEAKEARDAGAASGAKRAALKGRSAAAGPKTPAKAKAAAPAATRRVAKSTDVPKTSSAKATPTSTKSVAKPTATAADAAGQPLTASVLNGHATRSAKAPSDKAPTANGKAHAPLAHAPTDLVASALRGNPLKQSPGNIAIHAHQGASMRRAQGKRDSR
ncbi:MAG: hypothetical protein ACK4OE_23210 [Acidovorax sp.]|uniref:hypothetical protein n=1 Tax=Acidovorax sp. TaxID=1872122 RepID=UPI00391B85F1